jgi:hypothetical protein
VLFCVDSLVDGAFPIRTDLWTFLVCVYGGGEALLWVEFGILLTSYHSNEVIDYIERL